MAIAGLRSRPARDRRADQLGVDEGSAVGAISDAVSVSARRIRAMSVLVLVAAMVGQVLPQVTDLRICRVTFDPPKVVQLDNEVRRYTSGIEFVVDING